MIRAVAVAVLLAVHVAPASADPSVAWTAESNQAGAQLGYCLAAAGDVNGDGFGDVIVGAAFYDNGTQDGGRILAYHGSAAGLAAAPSFVADGDVSNTWMGYSVAAAGDVNGDGYDDVIVGAMFFTGSALNQGKALVFNGSPTGLSSTPSWTAQGDQEFEQFGFSVAGAGDVNGDGFSDVIVGAEGYEHGEENEGRAFLYLGSAAGLAATPAWTAESDQLDGEFGFSVAGAGDVNGDGYSDVIVGAPFYDNGDGDEGAAFVYLGSATGLAASAAWTVKGDQAGAWLGYQVASAGDVNGDGYSDVIVGAMLYDNGEDNEGRVSVYSGSASGLSAAPSWTAEGGQPAAWFGSSVASAGDVNGDGYSDVIVGAMLYDRGENDEGRAFVYFGSPHGLAASASWTAESDQASALLGYAVSGAGDVNGDGYADVLVGAEAYDNGEVDEGRAMVYGGTPDAGQAVAAGRSGTLVLAKAAGGELSLSWGGSCSATDVDYAVYEGPLGSFSGHQARSCSTGGATSTAFAPAGGNTYYLIVPRSGTSEGSYGKSSAGERPAGGSACAPQQIAVCQAER